ncbi:MAG TPA: hypothetical protein VIH91_06420 [Terriglobales bacterium]
MRLSISLLTFLLVLSAITLGQSASSADDRASLQEVSVPAGEATITGCLVGHHDGYGLTERDGTMHLLMPVPENKGLRSHVGDIVTLAGYRDDDRDASASSDEGAPHGLRFFQVNEIVSDSGKCK